MIDGRIRNRRIVSSAVCTALAVFACSGGGSSGDSEAPVSIDAPAVSSTSSTTAAPTSTTAESPPITTPPGVLEADGIREPVDAATFVITAWASGDREAASRHTDPGTLDKLFAADPPSAESLEFVTCDSADLERFDCFFVAEGVIYLLAVDQLRVVDASIEDEGRDQGDGGDDQREEEDDDDD